MESEDGVGLRRRVLAVTSMVVGAALVVVTVVFAARHVGALLIGVAGLALVAGGAWWVITERMPRRVIGVAGVAVGAVLVVVAVFNATPDVDRPVLRLVIVAVLFLVMVGCSRAALVSELHERDSRRPLEVTPPRHPVLLCNPWSGGGKVEQFGLVELAESMGVEVVMLDHGLDLETLARDAVARGADCLGMAGGDGSQALVASIAVEHDLPFVCVSAGTRNHFALDLGIDRDDPRLSLGRVPRRGRASHRLRDRRRSAVRQQRVARHLRHDRPAGGLPRRQGRHDQGAAAARCWVGPPSRSTSSSPSPTAPRSTAPT